MSSFFSLGARDRLKSGNKLLKILDLINWQVIEHKLGGVNRNRLDGKTAGQAPYSPLSMFKALILQNWHSLSDKELEDSLGIRIDFMLFCGFDLANSVPDETTICRFRNRLVEKGLDQILFAEINNQLEALGLKVKKADMAIVDATIIESQARPDKVLEQEGVEYKEKLSADKDAKWLKKGNKYYFGYKSFATVDQEGFINKALTAPANEAECGKLEIMSKVPAKRIGADKAYDSKENRRTLVRLKIRRGIMYKAYRGKPLTNWQKKFNKAVSKHRFVIEQSFGTIKRRFKFTKASYFTTPKVNAQFTLKAICLNLLKAINKVVAAQ